MSTEPIRPNSAESLSEAFWEKHRSGKDRRKRPTPMISRYLFVGRRRSNRRRCDREKGYYVDRPRQGLVSLALLIIFSGVLDAYFTYELFGQGAVEANPIINFCLDMGWGYCLAIKFVLTSLALLILVVHQNFFKMERLMGSICFYYALLVLYQVFALLSAVVMS